MTPPPAEGSWITLAQARRILGVNESTLRRWADAGDIHSFRTPGGHRRFSETDIRAMVNGVARGRAGDHYGGMSALAVSRIRRRLHHMRGPEPDWASRIDEAGRSHLREIGRRLVLLTQEYLANRRGRPRVIEEARAIGQDYGRALAGSGLSLRDAVVAFTFFRRSLDETVKQVSHRESVSGEEAATSWELINRLGDEVLIALADAYEAANGVSG